VFPCETRCECSLISAPPTPNPNPTWKYEVSSSPSGWGMKVAFCLARFDQSMPWVWWVVGWHRCQVWIGLRAPTPAWSCLLVFKAAAIPIHQSIHRSIHPSNTHLKEGMQLHLSSPPVAQALFWVPVGLVYEGGWLHCSTRAGVMTM